MNIFYAEELLFNLFLIATKIFKYENNKFTHMTFRQYKTGILIFILLYELHKNEIFLMYTKMTEKIGKNPSLTR